MREELLITRKDFRFVMLFGLASAAAPYLADLIARPYDGTHTLRWLDWLAGPIGCMIGFGLVVLRRWLGR